MFQDLAHFACKMDIYPIQIKLSVCVNLLHFCNLNLVLLLASMTPTYPYFLSFLNYCSSVIAEVLWGFCSVISEMLVVCAAKEFFCLPTVEVQL